MKKAICAAAVLGLVVCTSVTAFADNYASFSDTKNMQFSNAVSNTVFANRIGVSKDGIVDVDIDNGVFSCYNGYIYYLDKSSENYVDLKRMKIDKTEDTFIYRIVTGTSSTLDSYILGDSKLYYTTTDINTQKHHFMAVDLVTKRSSEIYSSDTAILNVLASQNNYAYVMETTFDENDNIHRLIYKVNTLKGTDKVVSITTKTNVNYTNAAIYGTTLYILKADFSENADCDEAIVKIDLEKNKIIGEIKAGSHNIIDLKSGYAIALDGSKITKIDYATGEETVLLSMDDSKYSVEYLGLVNGKVYYTVYDLKTYDNTVYSKNTFSGEKKVLTSRNEERTE